jgi:hypothetical protein
VTTVITARLTLAVRLVDTTTGKELSENDIRFFIGDDLVHPMKKGSGTYVFVNMGREDFLMRVYAFGYDDYETDVKLETLDPRLPMLDIFLMPLEKNRIGGSVLQISGTLSKLEYIEAIRLDHPIGAFQSVSTRKNVTRMTVLPMTTGGGVALDTINYAILSKDQQRYEVFTVMEQDASNSVILKSQLKFEHELNDRIFRIVYGRAGPKGKFVLKVRDESSSLPYLLHFKAGDTEYIRPIDFHLETGEIKLRTGATKIPALDETDETDEKEVKENE